MRRIEKFVCDICSTEYKNEKDASHCETAHREMNTFKIVGVTYTIDKAKDYGWNRDLARQIPSNVRIKFSEERGDFAQYKLVQVGFKGV